MWEYMEKWLMKCGRTWNELFFIIICADLKF